MVLTALLRLQESKSPCPVEIPATILKQLAGELSKPLSMLFNISFETGYLPPDWKSAWITPLYKGGFGSLRTITDLSASPPFADLAIETIQLLLQSKYDGTGNRLGRAEVLQLLKFSLRTYFTFDWTIYEEVKGTPMCPPISGFIVEAVLQRLDSLVFQHHKPNFWARYMDGTFVLIDLDQLLTFKERLNAVVPDI
nr:unnamed protein product [Spirometra erinaceieuropaei]